MQISRSLLILSSLIAILALVASAGGVFWDGDGQSFEFTSLRGQTVEIYGRGLYKYDSMSIVTQAKAQDTITLVLAIPLLVAAIIWSGKGKLRGKLLHLGILSYFLYTYASYCFLSAYNPFFLLYVTLFSMSLFAFVLAFIQIDVQALPAHIHDLPRRGIVTFYFCVGVFLAFMWLGLTVPTIFDGSAPEALESYTTLVIQALDLGIIVPLAILTGLLLLQEKPWGYVLSAVILIKGLTLGTAVFAMAIAQIRAGENVSPVVAGIFGALALISTILSIVYLRKVEEPPTEQPQI